MIVIVGLGNPGTKYSHTKHNIGFMVVDLLAERHGIKVSRLKHKAYIGDGMIAGKKVLLVKPQTFMNDSGQSVREALGYYDVAVGDLMVVYDDVDIPMGALRIRKRGSAGTHNGMRSIIYQLEDDGFPRFRVGIGGERGPLELYEYVLTGFPDEVMGEMREAVERCADAVEAAVAEGVEAAMLRYNVSAGQPSRHCEERSDEAIQHNVSSLRRSTQSPDSDSNDTDLRAARPDSQDE